MKVHLHDDLQGIWPIGWADAQESLGHVTVAGKAHQQGEAFMGWSLWAVPLQSSPITAMQNSGPSPGNSLLAIASPTWLVPLLGDILVVLQQARITVAQMWQETWFSVLENCELIGRRADWKGELVPPGLCRTQPPIWLSSLVCYLLPHGVMASSPSRHDSRLRREKNRKAICFFDERGRHLSLCSPLDRT